MMKKQKPSKLVLVPHNMGSRSAKELARVLSGKVDHKVWRVEPHRVKNRIPFTLKGGTDKLTQLTKFKEAGVTHPEFTTRREVALSWLPDSVVMCRTLLRASEGRGIVVAETPEQVVHAPLYTRYVKKKKEFRVHVFNGQVIDIQEKRKRKDFQDDRNTKVRNLANGYVFCRDGLVEPTGIRELAIKAAGVLGYTIGAVDIAFNERNAALVVLEVNACPGMQGATLEKYADAITGWYKGRVNALRML